jgi:hypothetical protein
MTVDDILHTPDGQFNTKVTWDHLDDVIQALPDSESQSREWNRVLHHAEFIGMPTGHPHFRLGILHLLVDTNEKCGLSHLQRAYEQDQKDAPEQAHRRAAYRVLSLVKDFLVDLNSKNSKDNYWQRRQLEPQYRRVIISMLFDIYDITAQRHILDMTAHTYAHFSSLIADDGLRLFAGENYMCAQSLLEWVDTDGGNNFIQTNEYAFARVVVGLYGGVLEALLADKLPSTKNKTLGLFLNDAYQQGHLGLGTRLCALCTIILHFRNNVHANKTASRTEYFVDRNVAKGLKVAIDVVISELLKQTTQQQTKSATTASP